MIVVAHSLAFEGLTPLIFWIFRFGKRDSRDKLWLQGTSECEGVDEPLKIGQVSLRRSWKKIFIFQHVYLLSKHACHDQNSWQVSFSTDRFVGKFITRLEAVNTVVETLLRTCIDGPFASGIGVTTVSATRSGRIQGKTKWITKTETPGCSVIEMNIKADLKQNRSVSFPPNMEVAIYLHVSLHWTCRSNLRVIYHCESCRGYSKRLSRKGLRYLLLTKYGWWMPWERNIYHIPTETLAWNVFDRTINVQKARV